ncbi:LAFA_0F20230g1_1 [Lachancea sp. 'fantastica']|nr:LAFA_0F20230g1_1 [Lachancea sp. 'fantastica']
MSVKIAAINEIDVGRITSGQVIVDLTSVVKELLDNSIDAGADQFECVFKNYGLESLECSDNGSGIPADSYAGLALKHHTSKISNFEDVSQVTTLGFRGEALSSLAAISNLVVTTTANPPKAARLEFNAKGELIKNVVTSRNKGTTVHISQLFNNLPVRKKDFTHNCKRHFNKCIALLQQYTIIQDKMKISIWHVTSNGRRTLVLSSTKDQGIPKRIVGVFGSSAMQGLSEINLDLSINTTKSWASQALGRDFDEPSEYSVKVSGYISGSSFGCGRNAKDRQFVYVNRRPVVYPALLKCCNEVYRTNNNVQFPALFLNFEVAPELIDVNITPDKRTVVLHSENVVIDSLRDALVEYFSDQEMVLPVSLKTKIEKNEEEPEFKRQKAEAVSQELDYQFLDDVSQPEVSAPQSEVSENTQSGVAASNYSEHGRDTSAQEPCIFVMDSEPSDEAEGLNATDHPENADASVSSNRIPIKRTTTRGKTQRTLDAFANPAMDFDADPLSRTPNASEETLTLQIGDDHFEERAVISRDKHLIISEYGDSNRNKQRKVSGDVESIPSQSPCTCSSGNEYEDEDDEDGLDNAQLRNTIGNFSTGDSVSQVAPASSSLEEFTSTSQLQSDLTETETPSQRENTLKGSAHTVDTEILSVVYPVDTSTIVNKFKEQVQVMDQPKLEKHQNFIQKNEQIEDFAEGEKYLTLSVSKRDFKSMNVVGQFNLGFILVTRRIGRKFDLFIIDQHASDEKFNFEMLQQTTVLKSQRLIAPQEVEMSIIDELITTENLEVFEKNGFKLEVDEDKPQGSRVRLVSLPISKKTIFDINDLHELIHLVRESDGLNKDAVRCSKVRSMLAMRACRSSIMVGKPLSKKMMVRVVQHLSELDKPWNCPHGRPTMRHLMELRDWNAFEDDYRL